MGKGNRNKYFKTRDCRKRRSLRVVTLIRVESGMEYLKIEDISKTALLQGLALFSTG